MVICLAIAPPLPTPPSRDAAALSPAFRSKTFQNFKLSSAAVGNVSPRRLTLGIHLFELTRSSQHLSVRAKTAVKDASLVCWDFHIANQRGVAPDAQ